MPLYQVAATFFTLSLVLMTLFQVLVSNRDRRALSFAILQVSLLGHLLLPFVQTYADSFLLNWVFFSLRNMIPTMFWLVCNLSFDDDFRLTPKTMAIPLIVALVPSIGYLSSGMYLEGQTQLLTLLMFKIPQWLELLLIAHALVTVTRSMRDDLVSSRRELRVWLLGSVGFYIALVVTMEQFFDGGPLIFVLAEPLLLALFTFIFYTRLLTFRSGLLFPLEKEPDNACSQALSGSFSNLMGTDNIQIKKLQTLMTEDKLYKQEGITIRQLAETMGMQEYRLRQLINQTMGYRNFNDFLNGYRITEACRRLSSLDEKDIAVLTIALDTGFRSLSAFNRAFKERISMTPSLYRKKAMSTSNS